MAAMLEKCLTDLLLQQQLFIFSGAVFEFSKLFLIIKFNSGFRVIVHKFYLFVCFSKSLFLVFYYLLICFLIDCLLLFTRSFQGILKIFNIYFACFKSYYLLLFNLPGFNLILSAIYLAFAYFVIHRLFMCKLMLISCIFVIHRLFICSCAS